MDENIRKRLKCLKTLATPEDLNTIENLIKQFQQARFKNSRDEMSTISKDSFPLEKRYIPKVNNELAEMLRCDCLIMTVGFQKEPIVLSILCLKPKKVVLLPTEDSRHIAQDVESDPEILSLETEIILTLITEFDAAKNYKIIKEEVLPKVSGNSFVDPTAGRKIMVASLALMACYHRIPMVYLHTLEHRGIAFPFMETLELVENPLDFFGDIEMKIIQDQFNCHLYEAAVKSCDNLRMTIRDSATDNLVRLIRDFAEIYRDWDSFFHSKFNQNKGERKKPLLSKRLEHIIEKFHRLGLSQYLPQNVDGNLKFLGVLDDTWKPKKNIADEYRLVDIFVSALRRGSEKQAKYDDAVARLYRCLEMCSTIKLLEKGIKDVAEPDYKNFADSLGLNEKELAAKFLDKKKKSLPSLISLDDQMTLLEIAGDKIAKIYNSMREGNSNLMEKRNRSILAHGTDSITKDDWNKFRDKTRVVIESAIGKGKFQELYDRALHGSIDLSIKAKRRF